MPIGWLYITYHLLREPETATASTSFFLPSAPDWSPQMDVTLKSPPEKVTYWATPYPPKKKHGFTRRIIPFSIVRGFSTMVIVVVPLLKHRVSLGINWLGGNPLDHDILHVSIHWIQPSPPRQIPCKLLASWVSQRGNRGGRCVAAWKCDRIKGFFGSVGYFTPILPHV